MGQIRHGLAEIYGELLHLPFTPWMQRIPAVCRPR
jgi:hypothetical protein